jgi:hypothetical protein
MVLGCVPSKVSLHGMHPEEKKGRPCSRSVQYVEFFIAHTSYPLKKLKVDEFKSGTGMLTCDHIVFTRERNDQW